MKYDGKLIKKWLTEDREKGLLERPKIAAVEKPPEEEEEISDEEWLKL